jgi:type IV pilus assembly protein PilX
MIELNRINENGLLKEGGAALIVSLLFLLIMTLTGIAAIQVATMEERMSGNQRDRNLAFQAAESALRAGEAALLAALPPATSSPTAAFGCTGAYSCSPTTNLSASSSVWSGARAVSYTGTLSNLGAPPKYIIELLTPVPQTNGVVLGSSVTGGQCFYRVTARGTGGSTNATVVLQSTYIHSAFTISKGEQCNGL